MKSVCVLTFDHPHLKTEQVLLGLAQLGYRQVQVAALPFKYRTPRVPAFAHRPAQDVAGHPRDVAAYLGYSYVSIGSDAEIPKGADFHLVGGAGLFTPAGIDGRRIVNAHPGIIPAARGLDAFKWAVCDDIPLGNTLHYIDEDVDAGEVISIVRTPVFASDRLAAVARRHYEIEVEMTINFERYLEAPRFDVTGLAERAAHMRMPRDTEEAMLRAAPAFIEKHSGTVPERS